MRKWQRTAVILLAVALVFSLTACGGNTAGTEIVRTVADSAAWNKAMDYSAVENVSITVRQKDGDNKVDYLYVYGKDVDNGGKFAYFGNAAGYDETSKYVAVIKLNDKKQTVSVTDEKNNSLPLLIATYSYDKDSKKWSMTTTAYTDEAYNAAIGVAPAEVLAPYIAQAEGKFDNAEYDKTNECYNVKIDNDELTVKFADGKLASLIQSAVEISIGNIDNTYWSLPAVDKDNVK